MRTLADTLIKGLHYVGTLIGIPALILLVSVDVFLRYVMNAPLLWGAEVSALLLLVVFFATLPYCTQMGGHIRMELFYERFTPGVKKAADVVGGLAGLIVSGLMTYQAFMSAEEMFRYEESAEMIDLPYWPFSVFMGICGLALTVQFIGRIVAVFKPRVQEGDA